MGQKYVMALDAGTTSNRAIIFDVDSKIVGVAQGARQLVLRGILVLAEEFVEIHVNPPSPLRSDMPSTTY